MKIKTFRGLKIHVENPAGSTRSGKDKYGKKWAVQMPYDYGELVGSEGTDGDPVDVFLGTDTSSPFVFVIHQLNKHTGEWDEDKCMLGFKDSEAAKAAYYKAYDGTADLFYGSTEAIPLSTFKQQVFKNGGNMIHAKMDVTVGDPVYVNGLRGRGIVVADDGSDVVIRYRNGEYFKRKKYNVTNLNERDPKMWKGDMDAGGPGSGRRPGYARGLNKWRSPEREREAARKDPRQRSLFEKQGVVQQPRRKYDPDDPIYKSWGGLFPHPTIKSGQEEVELEGNPIRVPHGTNKRIEKVGTNFCVLSDGVDKNFGCYPSREQAEAVLNGKSFIEPDLPDNLFAEEDPSDRKVKSASGMPQTGWQYGRRTMPVGYLPQRTLTGFPTGTGGGRGGLPKVPHTGTPTPKPHPHPTPHVSPKVAKPVAQKGKMTPPTHLAPPPKIQTIKPYKSPKVLEEEMSAFGDLGEPMAGAMGHAHIEPMTWFHAPSLAKRKKADYIPVDDPQEKDNRFLDVTKRKQAYKDKMKLLKRSTPGNTQDTTVPAHTTALAPHQAYFAPTIATAALKFKKRKGTQGGILLDVIPRNGSLKVPHQAAYVVPKVKARRTSDVRMRVAYGAARL